MLDRSPNELGSHGNDMDDLCGSDSDLDDDEDDDANETTTDGERVIYPWMKKIHVAGVGKYFKTFFFYCFGCTASKIRFWFWNFSVKLSGQ